VLVLSQDQILKLDKICKKNEPRTKSVAITGADIQHFKVGKSENSIFQKSDLKEKKN